MAKRKRGGPAGPRPFWSGTLAFGLVSLPVGLFPAHRSKPVSLHMVDHKGTRLARRYMCSKDGKPLEWDQLIRGYPVEKDRFVTVTDKELDALAPEKSQEIDLKRFVPVEELDPMRFERAYFLTPEKGATKAYRLLARAMETTGRAGVATFVMRGKEYLVALLSQGGILRAETLRFEDELRTPADVGLGDPGSPATAAVKRFQSALKPLRAERLDEAALEDRESQRLIKLARRKLKAGEDVLGKKRKRGARKTGSGSSSSPPDLLETLKRSLKEGLEPQEPAPGKKSASKKTASKSAARKRKKTARGKTAGKEAALSEESREALYRRAQARDLPGRSRMSKQELVNALSE